MNRCPSPIPSHEQTDLAQLTDLSVHVGSNPLLVQGNNGNTSMKVDGALWIKASGKWLANAGVEQIMVRVDLKQAAHCIRHNLPVDCCSEWNPNSRPSIETAMHAVLPQRVVVHVHCVDTIAWAIREDGQVRVAERLAGLPWAWIPYVSSGLPLAHSIEAARFRSPNAEIFVLANHGLVVCGESVSAAASHLSAVERRLAVARRLAPPPDVAVLRSLSDSEWRLPDSSDLHALGTDPVSRRILRHGTLYPCQAVFLGRTVQIVSGPRFSSFGMNRNETGAPFILIEEAGILLNSRITGVERAMLGGLAEVVQRTDAEAPVRYLTNDEVAGLLKEDVYRQAAAIPEPAGLRT